MSFPPECHDRLNSMPPLPERKTPDGCLGTRLINDFTPKKNYVLNLPYLQLAVRLGAKLDKIHSVLEFRQEQFLQPFMAKLIELRKNAKTNYANMLFKALGNSLAGECEN